MRIPGFGVALFAALFLVTASSRPEAHGIDEHSLDAAALREMFEGPNGRRETWTITPTLVVMSSVLEYGTGDLAKGFSVTNRRMTPADVAQLRMDLTDALESLTDGRLTAFRDVVIATPEPGTAVSIFQPGRIVVGRFRGVRAKTGNLGYGGRAARSTGAISGAAMMLDEQGDRDTSRRRLVRMHELGHALGYNHVTSRPSIMNPLVGSPISDFDRAAIRQAAPPAFGVN